MKKPTKPTIESQLKELYILAKGDIAIIREELTEDLGYTLDDISPYMEYIEFNLSEGLGYTDSDIEYILSTYRFMVKKTAEKIKNI